MRKTKMVVIEDEGSRDRLKTFVLTEMPAFQVEKWAMRAFLALSKAGIEVPEDVMGAGIAGIASFGLRGLSGLNFVDAEPLLDEMLDCVMIRPDPKQPAVTRPLIEDDIEEIKTLLRLRSEIFSLHTNFSTPGVPSTSTTPN